MNRISIFKSQRREAFLRGTILVAAVVSTSLFFACSKKEEKVQSVISSVDVAKELVAGNSIVKSIPTEISGLLTFDVTSDAYQRFEKSPWGGSSLWLEGAQASDDGILKALHTAGFNIGDPAFVGKNFSQIAVYTGVTKPAAESVATLPSATEVAAAQTSASTVSAPTTEGAATEAPPAVGAATSPQGALYLSIVARLKNPAEMATRISALREELKKAGYTVQDEAVKKGTAFSITRPATPTETPSAEDLNTAASATNPDKVFFGIDGDRFVGSTDLQALDIGLSTVETGTGPALLSTANFRQATKEFPEGKERFAVGYLDFNKLLSDARPSMTAEDVAEMEKIPLNAASWSMAMAAAPQSMFRLLYDPADERHKAVFSALSSSTSDRVFKAVPADPLAFLSIDGQTIRRFKDLALMSPEAPPELKSQLAVLDSVQRVAIAAKVAPVGQSMLPVPDVTILFETQKPEELFTQLTAVGAGIAQRSGMPGLEWRDKTIQDKNVKVMLSPFGFGVFVAQTDGMVIAASTEAQMQSALASLSTGNMTLAGLPTNIREKLSSSPTVGNLYLNFQAAGTLMENMGGLVSMYAPQSEEAKKYLSPESINEVKQLGVLVGSMTTTPGVIQLQSSYQPVATGPKQPA